jgi:hypothetical protein
MNMDTNSNPVRAVLGVAGIALIIALLWQAGPSSSTSVVAPAVSPLLSDGTLGRAVVEFIAAGVALGVLGVGVKLFAVRFGELRRAGSQRASVALPAPTVVELAAAFATASEFDHVRQPGFAPIVSLTEAQVQRQREKRDRERRRATLNSA